jgi:hypothetical protein
LRRIWGTIEERLQEGRREREGGREREKERRGAAAAAA